jgi:hypothetical protein
MHVVSQRVGRALLALGCLLLPLAARSASADSLILAWDPNVDPVTGYAVYVGSSQRIDVGNTTTFTYTNAVAGQQYCFAVAAYSSAGEGPKSSQVCGFSNRYPTLTNPGNQSSSAGQSVSLQLVGSDPDGQPVSYLASGLPPGLSLGTATGFISGTLSTSGTFSVTASVNDGVLTSSPQSFTWSVAAAPTADTTAPSVTISGPTTSSTYATTSTTVSLSGAASDNVGVSVVTWANDRGGSGTATGTGSWSIPSIGLQSGSNVITVTATDAAGNKGSDVLTVTYSAPDTTVPSVTISSPTTSSSYATTTSTLALGGSASDNVGVTQVTWSNDKGGSGTASGTTSWTIASVTLQSGTNAITVTAQDAAGNKGTKVLTVTYTPPDTTAPSVGILGPTSASTYATASNVVTLGGTASDNLGVTAVTWANDRGGSGFSSGTTSWSVASVTLQSGTNIITVTAQDAAGNKGTDVLTVTYTPPDTTAPAITISSPTTSASYTAPTASVDLSGSASDNVGVTRVSWVNDRGGSGTATGTTSWYVPTILLQTGTNVITVTARDAAGNQATDVLTVTYSSSSSTSTSPSSITLTGSVYASGKWVKSMLQWTTVSGRYVDVYRNGSRVTRTSNDGSYTDSPKGNGPFIYYLCVTDTNICSNSITLSR